MDDKQIQEHANDLADDLVATGRGEVSVDISCRSHSDPRAIVRHGDWARGGPAGALKIVTKPTLEDVIAAVAEYIHGLPSRQEEKQMAFMRHVGKLLDEAHANGIDAAFVNPLEVLMKQLSENAITHEPSHDD